MIKPFVKDGLNQPPGAIQRKIYKVGRFETIGRKRSSHLKEQFGENSGARIVIIRRATIFGQNAIEYRWKRSDIKRRAVRGNGSVFEIMRGIERCVHCSISTHGYAHNATPHPILTGWKITLDNIDDFIYDMSLEGTVQFGVGVKAAAKTRLAAIWKNRNHRPDGILSDEIIQYDTAELRKNAQII